jgi:hypothetical protein
MWFGVFLWWLGGVWVGVVCGLLFCGGVVCGFNCCCWWLLVEGWCCVLGLGGL